MLCNRQINQTTWERKERKQLRYLMSIVFLGFLGLTMPYLIFPPLFLNPNYHLLPLEWGEGERNILLGLALASYPFGQFVGSALLGSLSDLYGRSKVMAASLFLASLLGFLTAAALSWGSVFLVILSRLASGFMEGNIAIARAMAADMTALDKKKTLGAISAAMSGAYLVGPSLGACLADDALCSLFGPPLPFVFAGMTSAPLALMCLFFLKDTRQPKESTVTSLAAKFNLKRRLQMHLADRSLGFLLLVSSLFSLCVDLFYEFGPVYLTLEGEHTFIELLPYNAFLCLALILGSGILAAKLALYWSSAVIIVFTMMAFGLLMSLFALLPLGKAMLVLFFAAGILIGIATTHITVQLSDKAPTDCQGEILGLQCSIRVLFDALICIAGGLILSFLSSSLLLALTAPICLGVAYAYFKRVYLTTESLNSLTQKD